MTQAIALHNQSPSLFPSPAEWNMLKEQATMVVKTGLLPQSIKTAEQAIAIALKGRELGVPPMHAYSHIHIIQGKPTISAELMLSLIYKNCPGAVINYLEASEKACVIETKRPGHAKAKFSYTIEEARKAGLLNKDSWKNYTSAMLRARCVSIVGRAVYADAIMGCSYIPEELGADVNDDGDVIDLPSAPAPAPQVLPPAPAPRPAPGDFADSPSTLAGPKVKTRGSVGAEIVAVAKEMKLSDNELAQWAKDHSGVSKEKMTVPQLEAFLGELKYQHGRNAPEPGSAG